MANFFTQQPSAAQLELLRTGRATMSQRLERIVGDGARVDTSPEPIVDTESGRMLDRFTIHTVRPLAMQSRALLQVVATNVFHGERKLRVDIDWSRYDTRWFASDWTSQQRALGAGAVLFAFVLLASAMWFEHYRVEQLGGASLIGAPANTFNISALWFTA